MRGEKEHYMKEYHRLLEQVTGRSDRTDDAVSEAYYVQILCLKQKSK